MRIKPLLNRNLILSISSTLIAFIISLAAYSIEEQQIPFPEDKPAKLFVLKCAGCHTVGGGALTGPDLKKAVTFQHSDLLKAISRMQEQVGPLTREETDELAKFLESEMADERIKKESQRIAKLEEARLDPPNAKTGQELFLGTKSLKNGGLSCISCHNVASLGKWGGGKLGPSLETAFNKFGKHNLASAIENSNWKVMKETYKNHPITKQESVHLVGFFRSIKDEPIRESGNYYLAFSGLGCLFLYIGIALLYKKRLRGVRKNLTKK